MLLKNFLSYNNKKEELIYETSNYKMYDSILDGKKATKFIYNTDIKQYENLKKIHHDNLMCPLKINLRNRTIYTIPLLPFEFVYSEVTNEFNEYIFSCLAKTINFLHKKCSLQHNNINSLSLFFSENCKIVLGGFEKSIKTDYFDSDDIQFSNLILKYMKINRNIQFFVNSNIKKSFFYENEIFYFGFDSYSIEEKNEFIFKIKKNKDQLVEIFKKKTFFLFLKDLKTENNFEYKENILNFIIFLDIKNFDEILPELFYVLDSNVRLYLFSNSKKYINKIKALDSSLNSILLGLKVKNKKLKKETIIFLQKNIVKISEQNQVYILECMYNTISDKEEIFLVLNYILETNPRFGNKDIVYNICKKYITISGCKNETLKVIKKFYTYFNKYKVSTELLPLICTYLADEKIQSFTFCLIEDI